MSACHERDQLLLLACWLQLLPHGHVHAQTAKRLELLCEAICKPRTIQLACEARRLTRAHCRTHDDAVNSAKASQ